VTPTSGSGTTVMGLGFLGISGSDGSSPSGPRGTKPGPRGHSSVSGMEFTIARRTCEREPLLGQDIGRLTGAQ